MEVRSKVTPNCLAGFRANRNIQPSIGANVEKNHQTLVFLAQLFINTRSQGLVFSSFSCSCLQLFDSKNKKLCVCVLSGVQFFAVPWTLARQTPPSMEFSNKNTGAGCHFLLQENPHLLHLLHWQVDSLPLHHLGSLQTFHQCIQSNLGLIFFTA